MTRRLHDWLTGQAQHRPESCAVVFHRQTIRYGHLDQASNQLARALRAAGCVRGDRVALLLPKSIQALVGMFGSLKAGCIYVPLDTSSPAARITKILEQCEIRCLLVNGSTANLHHEIATLGGLPASARIVWMDSGPHPDAAIGWDDVCSQSPAPVDSPANSADPVHILFTSGSTGTPKGVVITHDNIIRFVDWAVPYFGIEASDRISCHPPLHFDLSMFDIYGAVAAGAEVHLLPPELNLLPHRLAAHIRDSRLTQWFSVPSVLNHMAKSGSVRWNDFPDLRRLLWCGAKLPTPALMYWMQRIPHASFFNLYGPTEATIASSCYRVPSCPTDETAEVSIGPPCDGEQLLVLDEHLQPVAPGESGELYIAGLGLSPGYWRDPRKTGEVFLPNPSNPTERIYRTGDLAKVGYDGLIYHLGRIDSQIKSRGCRIELGEIETAVHAIPGVHDAAVVAIDTGGFESTVICCAFVPSSGSGLSPAVLKRHLARVLPQYMLPANWMVLDRMPLNSNGKADRPHLKQEFLRQAIPAPSVSQTQTAG